VLRRVAMSIARDLGWPLESSRSNFLPESSSLAAFKGDQHPARPVPQEVQDGLISNIDDKLLGHTRRHFKADFDLVVTAQQVRSYKPDPAHLKEASAAWAPRRAGSTSRRATTTTWSRA
jgi:2-haloacid dehalogenase/putative hydrolase of the HAD superfamily